MTSSPLTEQQLADIDARAQAATEGPWCTDSWEIYQGTEYEPGISLWIGETCRGTSSPEQDRADAEFVAHARTDVSALLAEIRRLQAELARQERLHGDTIDDRDRAQDAADKLAYAVASEDVIGEHTADNSPWANAFELITPAADVAKLRQQVAEVLAVHERGEHNGLAICLHCASQMFPPPETGIWSESAYPCATLRALGIADPAAVPTA